MLVRATETKVYNAIRIRIKNFTKKELLQLITSNDLSILYSEIWHLQNLKPELKQKLVSISACAIKTCMLTL